MILDLRQINENPGERMDFDYEVPASAAEGIDVINLVSPISVKGAVVNKAGMVFLELTADYALGHTCDRCLIGFEREYSFSMKTRIVRSQRELDDDYIEAPDDKLDLDEQVISELLLRFPSKVLCKEDCKGLCSVCGTNLNNSECECRK